MKFLSEVIALTLCFVILSNAQLADRDWWKRTVIYQIYPKSFQDSDGDGLGDLRGITSRLQHLKDAGIGATWISPFYKSPQYDSGYDISDFYDIQPEFGTLKDFDDLLAEAKRLGIKIILDFIPNHTSDEHEWFKQSLDKSSPYADWYMWDDGKTDDDGNRLPPNNWVSVFRKSAWEYRAERDQFYLHQFAKQQPDLNFRNPNVVAAMKEVVRFWLRKGVAGFRIDALNHLFEVNKDDFGGVYPDEPLTGYPGQGPDDYGYVHHIYTKDVEDTYWMAYEWRKVADEFTDETKVMMIEAYTSVQNSMKYLGNDTSIGCHMAFNFGLIEDVNEYSNAKDIKFFTDKWLTYMPSEETANWVMGNHDKWRVATRYGVNRADGLNMMVLLLPGVGVTYNGEEIGMMNNNDITWEETQDPQACNTDDPINYWKSSRDPARTPYQWSAEKNAGFSTANKTWLPVNTNYPTLNLAAQKTAEKSTFKVYQSITALRTEMPFVYGGFESVAINNDVFAFQRYLEGNETYVVVINIADRQHTVDLSVLRDVFGEYVVATAGVVSDKKIGDALRVENLSLKAYESLVLRGNSTRVCDNNGVTTSVPSYVCLIMGFLVAKLFLS